MNSKLRRICLVGATGLVGSAIMKHCTGRDDVHMVGVGRRRSETVPPDAEFLAGEPIDWPSLIRESRADVLVCALGTTMKAAGSRPQFRAIDHDLIRYVAEGAVAAGITHMIVVSSVGADRQSRSFYLQVKGETEDALARLPLKRLDVLRPSLLRGRRGQSRPLERLGQLTAPVVGALLFHGPLRRYRSIRVSDVAKAIVSLAEQSVEGRFVHEFDAIVQAASRK